jgi:hypothetical protein
LARERERGAGAGMQAAQEIGIRPAPRYVTQSPAERYIDEHTDHSHSAPPTGEQKIAREIEKAVRANKWDKVIDIAEKAIKAGQITDAQVEKAMKAAQVDPLLRQYEGLSVGNAIEASKLMSPEERKRTDDMLDKKIDNAMKKASPVELTGLLKKLDVAGLLK